MTFISPRQRQAVMARLRRGQRQLARVSPQTKLAAAGIGTAGAIALATRQPVMHFPRSMIVKEYGPYLAAYAAAPILAHAISGSRRKESSRTKAKGFAGAGLVGVGTFLGERALWHTGPIFQPAERLAHYGVRSKSALVVQHSIPLAAAAVGTSYLGAKLLSKPRRAQVVPSQEHAIGAGITSKLAYKAGVKAVLPHELRLPYNLGVVPAYQLARSLRHRFARQRRRAA